MKLRTRLVLTGIAIAVPLTGAVLWIDVSARERELEANTAAQVLAFMQAGGRSRCEADPSAFSAGHDDHHGGPPRGFDLFGDGHQEGPGGDRRGPHGPGHPGPPPDDGPPPPGMDGPPPFEGHGPDGHGPHGPRDPLPPGLRVFAYDSGLHSQNAQAPDITGLEVPARAGLYASRSSHVDDRVPSVDLAIRMPWSTGPCAVVLARRSLPRAPFLAGRNLPPPGPLLLAALSLIAALLTVIGPVVTRIRRLTEQVRRLARNEYSGEVDAGGSDEVTELALAFDHAAREIRSHLARQEQREAALRKFLENTTHDVMIPLTVLQGHIASLSASVAQGAAPDAKELAGATEEAHYIGALLRNLSLAARLDAGEPGIHRSRVDLNEVVTRAMTRHQPIARAASVSLDGATPSRRLFIDADVTLVEQAVSNVISNAIKHNKPGGHAAVLLEEAGGARFSLKVIDDGPGIPEDELPRIQERYVRGNEARTRGSQGSGIGLHIVSQVATAHGWTLELARSSFGGLEVRFSGPVLAD